MKNRLKSTFLHFYRHIAEDIGDWSNDPHLTDEEMEFRYFKYAN